MIADERPRAAGTPPRNRRGGAVRQRGAAPLRQPRLRGEHAGDGRRLGRRRGLRAVVQQRPPRHGREVAGLDRGLRARPRGRRAFVGAPDASVVFVRNTTEAVNVLAAALPPNTRVLSTPVEHHANMLPWRRHDLHMLPFTTSADELLEVTARALQRDADRPARRHRRLQRHRRGLAAQGARDARPRARRAAVRRRRPARAAPRARDGRGRASTTSRSRATSSTRRSAPARSSARARSAASRCCTAAARSSSSRSTT